MSRFFKFIAVIFTYFIPFLIQIYFLFTGVIITYRYLSPWLPFSYFIIAYVIWFGLFFLLSFLLSLGKNKSLEDLWLRLVIVGVIMSLVGLLQFFWFLGFH